MKKKDTSITNIVVEVFFNEKNIIVKLISVFN